MRRSLLALPLLAFLLLPVHAASAAAPAAGGQMWLVTDYPAITAEAGSTTNIDISVINTNLPPEPVALSVDGVPEGWSAVLTGNGHPVAAVMPGTNQTVNLELRLKVPAGQHSAATHQLTVHARGEGIDRALPIRVAIARTLPPQIELEPKLPSLRGTLSSDFNYDFTLKNESSKNLVVKLAADTPPNFKATFTEQYGDQELNSIPIDAGKSKDLKLKVSLPPGAAAGTYNLKVHAEARGAQADMPLTMVATGEPKVTLASKTQRLNADAEAGQTTQIQLVVSNDGSASADKVDLSATTPTNWKIDFTPKTITDLGPGEKTAVTASLTPAAKAIAGDYMTTIKAGSGADASSADFRVSVRTSTMWGAFGLAVIAIALLVLVGAVVRFGRR